MNIIKKLKEFWNGTDWINNSTTCRLCDSIENVDCGLCKLCEGLIGKSSNKRGYKIFGLREAGKLTQKEFVELRDCFFGGLKDEFIQNA